MRPVVATLIVLALGLVTAAQGPASSDKDLNKLQGSWKRAAAETDGKKVSAEELQKTTLTIKGDEYILKTGDQTRKGHIKLDATKKPKQIDIISDAGPNKGKKLLGIYELEGDTFRYCVAQPGKDRPTEFASRPGSGVGLYVNKREKP